MRSELKRRNFLRITGSVLFSGLGSVLLSGLGSGCRSASALAAADREDELKRLQALLADRRTPLKWLFTGDSITQGARHTYGYRSYPEIFSERIRFEMNRSRDLIINSAISGHATSDILNDWDWRIGQFHPHVVSLMVGTNDAAVGRKISVTTFELNLRTLVQKFRSMAAIPILHTPNPIRVDGKKSSQERLNLPHYVEAIRTVAGDMKVVLVDHWSTWEVNKQKVREEKWLADSLHPGGTGHLEMARLLFSTLSICDEQAFTCTGTINFLNQKNIHE